ncbi:MFS transporter [Patescibacteria group bacterium]
MDRLDRLKQNPKLLFWAKAFADLRTLNAIGALFYLHRGLSIDQIFYLSIFWSITTLILEVPSGYLADRIGRKRTMIIGAFVLFLSWIVAWYAHSFPAFIFSFVLTAASFSAFSGTEEAILYDTLKETGNENQMTKHNGRLQSARHLFKIFIPTIGAFIAKDLLESQFKILIGIDIIAAIISIIILARLIEPKHKQDVSEYEKGIFRESLHTIKEEPFLFRLAMNKTIMFITVFIVWRMYQPFLLENGISVIWLGIYYVLIQLIAFSSSWYISEVERKIGTAQLLSLTVLLSIPLLLILFVTKVSWILFVALLLFQIVTTIRIPVFAQIMNKRIKSRSRATTLSNLNVFKSILDIPILLLAGYLATTSLYSTFIIAIALCLATLIFFPIRQKDLI